MNRPKKDAAKEIESMLGAAAWSVQDSDDLMIPASGGVAVRDLRLARDYGVIDYLLYVDGKVAGLIEIDTDGTALTGVDPQDERYRRGLPILLPVYTRPLPFLYQSDGERIRFTNAFDSEPCSRALFAFHKAETLKGWIEEGMIGSMPRDMMAAGSIEYGRRGATLQERLWINMPPLIEEGLSQVQIKAITSLEQSLKKNRPRALIQMEDSSERRSTAIHIVYRLIRFAEARRVLFLVNSSNMSREVYKLFQDYLSPYDNTAFTKAHHVQHLTKDKLDLTARVCITTLPRIYDILTDHGLSEKGDEKSPKDILEKIAPIQYNRNIPIETFDVVVIESCSSPITLHFRRVLDYFDAYLIGLGAEPDEQTIELFDRNFPMRNGRGESDGLIVISED